MSFSEIYQEAGRILKENLGKILVTILLYALITSVAVTLIAGISGKIFEEKSILILIPTIIAYLALTYFSTGLCAFFQKLARNEETGVEELLSPRPNIMGLMIPMFVLGIIIGAVAFAGAAIILGTTFGAGMISYSMGDINLKGAGLGLMFGFTVYTVVILWISLGFSQMFFIYLDNPEFAGLNLLSDSWRMMRGNKLKLFLLLFGISVGCFIIAALLAAFVKASAGLGGILAIIVAIIMVVCIGPYYTLCLALFYDAIRSGTTRTRNSVGITDEQTIENIVEEIGKQARKE